MRVKSANYVLIVGLMALSSGVLVSSCALGPTTRDSNESSSGRAVGVTGSSSSPEVEELDRFVLIIQESPSGHVTHNWRPVEEVDLSLFRLQPRAQSTYGRIMLAAARQRDCHGEFNECINMCLKQPLSEDYSHITSYGAKRNHCTKLCMQPYLDCEELQERRPQEFSATAQAVDWLKRNRTEALVGSLVVVAGVAFIVAFPPGALIALVPVAAVAASEVACEPHHAAVAVAP